MPKQPAQQTVEALTHAEASRKYIPTAEYRPLVEANEREPIQVAYERRNKDLDPQLVWRGKDLRNWSDLVTQAPPLYIQDKIHPKALVDDLIECTRRAEAESRSSNQASMVDLFADFNGLPPNVAQTEFYRHDANWSNRMILGDSLHVMASLVEREGLRGKVQCIYIDPPYGIKFNSNFQQSTFSRDVKDGKRDHITREPEQIRAFRDTWRDGIHSYLTYLRDRLTVARDLLAESGSVFLQIGDDNIARARLLMDEVFGEDNFVNLISYAKTTGFSSANLSSVCDYIIWYAKSLPSMKYRPLFDLKGLGAKGASKYRSVASIMALNESAFESTRFATSDQLTSQGASLNSEQRFSFRGKIWTPSSGLHWKTTVSNLARLAKAGRIMVEGKSIRYVRFLDDSPVYPRTNLWLDIGGIQSRTDPKVYVVQTSTEAVKRCILMTTDPSDIVLDPTCGAGTSAYVSEQWGRRWIMIDTSRVALALARARIMGARFPSYILLDSEEGQDKQASIQRRALPKSKTQLDVRQGFVYEKVPHITLKSIAENVDIDVIWNKYQSSMEQLRTELNALLGVEWNEWDIPRSRDNRWPIDVVEVHSKWWELSLARQGEIDASIKAKAAQQYLYDRPYENKARVRVSGPFTVESVSPHRMLTMNENDEFVDTHLSPTVDHRAPQDFSTMILENLRTSGVQQAHKEDGMSFAAIVPWPGRYICAYGEFDEDDDAGSSQARAAIMIGPEFGSVSRPDMVAAVREAAEGGFGMLVACAFNFDAHVSDLDRLGPMPILKARMNADLHMAEDLRNTGKGNLFVVFGEPDIEVLAVDGDDPNTGRVQVRINGIDVYDPNSGSVRSRDTDGIACWFVDTDYNEESFFVRQAYFLGRNDPYGALKTTLKADIIEEVWNSLHSDISRPFVRPMSGRIAVKAINCFGDEVMRVIRVGKSA